MIGIFPFPTCTPFKTERSFTTPARLFASLQIELSMLISKCFDHYFQFMLRFYIQG